MSIDEIRALAHAKNIHWTLHALKRLEERAITIADCMKCLLEGEIIEDYPTDKPFPSCLMLDEEQPLHLVCSIGEDSLIVITAYVPDIEEWDADLKRRNQP